MVDPINVFAQIFGGLLAGMASQGASRYDSVVASDTMDRVAITASAKNRKDASSEIQVLRSAIDKLILVDRALWEIIAASQGLTDEYLLNKIKEVDLRDGALDGKIKLPVRKCASCGKILPVGRGTCIYCGTRNEYGDPFDIHTDSCDAFVQGIV